MSLVYMGPKNNKLQSIRCRRNLETRQGIVRSPVPMSRYVSQDLQLLAGQAKQESQGAAHGPVRGGNPAQRLWAALGFGLRGQGSRRPRSISSGAAPHESGALLRARL